MARRTFPKDAGERVTLQARTTTATRDRLQEAANDSGRSLSQEMEMRLEQSLLAEDITERTGSLVLGYIRERDGYLNVMTSSRETFSLLEDIFGLVVGVEADQETRWFESAELRARLFKVIEAALPELLRADRGPNQPHAWLRAVDYAKYLPERPKKHKPEMPKGARFMTDEELKKFFHLNKDNA